MRKTTLEMKSLRAKHRYSDEMPACPVIQNHSLLEHFYAFVQGIPESGLKDDQSELYMKITKISCRGSSVFVTIESGIFGDNGKVYDVDTGTMKYPKRFTDSMTTSSRIVMYQPPEATMSMFAVEKTGDSRGFFLLNSFTKALRQYNGSYTYQTANIYEADDWVEMSNLIKVSVTAYKKNYSHRAGLGDKNFTADFVQSITPSKGENKFDDWIKQLILSRQIDAASLFEIPESLDRKSSVTLQRDTTTKTFDLGKPGKPIYREILTDNGEPPLDDDAFLRRAAESAASRYKQINLDWSTSYEEGDWSEEQLAFHWEVNPQTE